MTPDITMDNVIGLLEAEVAKEGRDYVYPLSRGIAGSSIGGPCLYVQNDQPSCLVGRVLAAAGVPLDVLKRCDGVGALRNVVYNGIVDLPPAVLEVLAVAQARQDRGDPWGAALDRAKTEHEDQILRERAAKANSRG